jgi:hypothetical protein
MDTKVNVPKRPETPRPEELLAWLEYAASSLTSRWEELRPALSQIARDHPAISDGDEETAEVFTQNLRMAAVLRSAVETFHEKEKAPYWTLGKKVDAWTGAFTDTIDKAAGPLRAALRDFTIRRDRARVFEDKEPIRSAYGARASLKETWGYEVEDIAKVPMGFHMIDDRLVRAVMADRDPKTKMPRQIIPGIRWVKNQTLAVS